MKIVNKFRFCFGVFIILFLIVSYFIKIEVDSGANYLVVDTLLGIVIFHSLFVFIIYLFVAALLIFMGFKRFKLV
jgi:hypothetical protein